MRLVRLSAVIALAAGVLFFAGCAAPSGWGPMGHGTTTVLKKANFKVSKVNVNKSVEVPMLFGIHANLAGFHLTLAGIPLGDYELWKLAMKELSNEAGSGHLVNVSSDYTVTSYFWIFNIHKLTLTADVVEFTGM